MNALRLVTVSEIARRSGVVPLTARRRLSGVEVTPDAILVSGEGENEEAIPLFVEPRATLIARLISKPVNKR